MGFLEYLFFSSTYMIFHAYFGYPLTLAAVRPFRSRPVDRGEYLPDISVIITVYNEEKKIAEKLGNTIASEYPREKMQILVASDGSSDRTVDIARGFGEHGVDVLCIPERKGKENAQKEAVRTARGEILVFSDVATMLDPDGLTRIVSNFRDASVGAVSSEDRLVGKDGKVSGEGAYVRYEMWLRRLESDTNSVVGLSGSFFAARKSVCEDFSGDMQSDFRTVLNSMKLGLRAVSDPGAIGYYLDIKKPGQEFDRKVRTVLRGLTVFFRNLEFLNVFRYGLFSYQYFCHKLIRWSVPFLMALAFVSNGILVPAKGSLFYGILFAGQVAFYGAALLGMQSDRLAGIKLLQIPKYFLTVNASIALAWWKYFRRERVVLWNPSER